MIVTRWRKRTAVHVWAVFNGDGVLVFGRKRWRHMVVVIFVVTEFDGNCGNATMYRGIVAEISRSPHAVVTR